MSPLLLLGLAWLGIAAALVACSPDDDLRNGGVIAIEPDADLVTGGILDLALPEAPPHLDPHRSFSPSVLNWSAGLVYSRLLRFHETESDIKGGKFTLSKIAVCDLCETWVQIDDLTFEFVLRDDIRWHDVAPLDGRRLTAQDLVDSYVRQATPGLENAFLLQNFESFTAVNNRTLRVVLKQPDAEVLEKLAHAGSSIVPKELFEGNPSAAINDRAIGTGPWVLQDFGTTLISLSANPEYYERNTDGQPLPYLDGLSIRIQSDDFTRGDGVIAGFFEASYLNPRDLALFEPSTASDPRILPVIDHSAGVEVLFNPTVDAVNSAEFRRAALLAWDARPTVSEVWGNDTAPSTGLAFPDPSLRASADLASVYAVNRAEANALLNSINFNPARPIELIVGDFSDDYIALAETMEDGLQSLGVPVELSVVTTREYGESVWFSGNYEVAIGPVPPVFSTSDKLLSIYHSEGPANTSSYADGELDRLIETQAGEYDLALRTASLNRIEAILADDLRRISIAAGATYWIVGDCVQGFVPNTSGNNGTFLARTWLSDESCHE